MMKRRGVAFRKTARRRGTNFLFLFRDDLVFDLRIGGLGNDFFSQQVGLLRVGTAVDDFL